MKLEKFIILVKNKLFISQTESIKLRGLPAP